MKPAPTLNPFGAAEAEPPSLWGPIIIAVILGIATSAAVLYWRWPTIGAKIENIPAISKTRVTTQSKDWDYYTGEVENLMKELQEERSAYEKKTKDLAAVEMRIETEKKELVRTREELLRLRGEIESMREELSSRTTEMQESEKSNIRNLSRTYANMKPAEAVAIFVEMSDDNVAKLLAGMKNDVVAKILGEMAKTKDPKATENPTADAAGAEPATLAPRAAAISEKLRLLKKEQTTASAQ
jgi:flagellar motility protein MotE (MotC chaperone)